LAGFLNSRFDIQGLDFHIEPPLGSSRKTKPQAARKNACGGRHDNRGAARCHSVQRMHPQNDTGVAVDRNPARAGQAPGRSAHGWQPLPQTVPISNGVS